MRLKIRADLWKPKLGARSYQDQCVETIMRLKTRAYLWKPKLGARSYLAKMVVRPEQRYGRPVEWRTSAHGGLHLGTMGGFTQHHIRVWPSVALKAPVIR